jgi:hypothetical protein
MEFYAATKKNELLSFGGKWMELENIILSAVSQVQKARGNMFSFICGIQAQYKHSYVMKTGHTQGTSHTREGGSKKEAKKVNMVDVLSIQE